MLEAIFLAVLGVIWILFASIQDLRQREVVNWLSFSLIVFALGFRFFYCLFSTQTNFMFFYQGLIGLAIFFILGNLFYYARIFAGGDAKLMIALGTVLGFSESFYTNLKVYFIFLLIFLFSGILYGTFWVIGLMIKNFKRFKKEFYNIYKKNLSKIWILNSFALLIMLLGFFYLMFLYFGIFILLIIYFYIYSKAIEEACMVKKINSRDLVEGDWLYKDLKLKNKIIKSTWDGLNKKDIVLIKKEQKFVLVKQGIPFVPVFLIAFLILLYIWSYKLILGFCFLN